ncbi:MAG: prepilin-type N-terminal cleavage/methylation domain-containing protein [Myxococcota bacterium]
MHARARGFTLIELVVGLTVSLLILGAALQLMVMAMRDGARSRVRAALLRDGNLAAELLHRDLAMAGLGVPFGARIGPGGNAPAGAVISSSVLVGGADYVGVLGDLPRPDAQYNTFGFLHDRAAGDATHIAFHNENNGACMPTGCSTADSSVFFPGESGCTNSGSTDRTCPWGMRRLSVGDRVQIMAGNGEWFDTTVASFNNSAGFLFLGSSAVMSLEVNPGFDNTVWANNSPLSGPANRPGTGWVTTLDRVFYRLNGTALERVQCWGEVIPTHASWPPDNAGAMPANPCGVTNNTGTGFERIARDVVMLELRYFDSSGAELARPLATAAAKAAVSSIRYRVRLERMVNRSNVTHEVVGTVRVRN